MPKYFRGLSSSFAALSRAMLTRIMITSRPSEDPECPCGGEHALLTNHRTAGSLNGPWLIPAPDLLTRAIGSGIPFPVPRHFAPWDKWPFDHPGTRIDSRPLGRYNFFTLQRLRHPLPTLLPQTKRFVAFESRRPASPVPPSDIPVSRGPTSSAFFAFQEPRACKCDITCTYAGPHAHADADTDADGASVYPVDASS